MCTMMSAVQRMCARLSVTPCTYSKATWPLTDLLPLMSVVLDVTADFSHNRLGYPARDSIIKKVQRAILK